MKFHSFSTDTNIAGRFLTEQDLAERWRISAKTLRNARVNGKLIEFTRIGKLVRYSGDSILAWEAANKATSTSDRGAR